MLTRPTKVSIPIAFIANYYAPALIVDNDISNHRELLSHLSNFGFQGTEFANDGFNARVCIAARPRLGLLIIDLATPKLDGIAIIKDIALFHPNCSIILLSALDANLLQNARVLAESLGLDVLAVHKKPLEKEKLHALLSDGIGSKKIKIRKDHQTASIFQLSKAHILRSLPNVELHFQPKICLRTREVIGCEALVRLALYFGETPRILPPNYFIHHFEVANRMKELTAVVVEKSLDGLKYFRDQGMDIGMSINLSAHDIESRSFPSFIENKTKSRSLHPDQITLEITVQSLSQNLDACQASAKQLRKLGFNVSIDGVGARFNNFNQLLPFNEVKLDRAFIRDSLNYAEAFTALESSIDMAKDHLLNIVAVGIESEEERNIVSNLGGDIGQGFLFSRPQPMDKFVEWHRHSTKALPTK